MDYLTDVLEIVAVVFLLLAFIGATVILVQMKKR